MSKNILLKNKKGMTLVEMLVALVIFVLGMLGFTMLASKSWKMNSFVMESGNATRKATQALNETVKSLRKARQADDGSFPIKAVAENSLTVYLDDDNDGKAERVHYYLDSANQLFKKGVTEPSNTVPITYPTDDQVVTTVANYVVNDASRPVFEYYNGDYPIDTTNNPLVAPTPSEVKLVKIHFWVNIKPLTAPENVNLESFAELRNLNETN
ncbi:MAG: prepilin-type N-terminal cleavage/methylation domain-containing protein [Candidatus Moraniibacteriota bacterium]